MTEPTHDDLVTILVRHTGHAFTGDEMACRCDAKWRTNREHAEHVATALVEHVVARADLVALADALRDEERGDPWQALTVARLRALAGGDQ